MKIVYFIDNLRGDGTQTILVQLISGLAKRGHEQAVVCLNDSYDELILARLRQKLVEVRIVGRMALFCGYGLCSTALWLINRKFDCVVTMLFVSDVVGRGLAWWCRVPRVLSSLRARNIHYSPLQRWLVRITSQVADAVIINNPGTREFAAKFEGIRPERIVFIPNGVHVGRSWESCDPKNLRAEMGLPASGFLLGTVGRLTHQKGIDVLLHALTSLSDHQIGLVIIGTGEMEADLRALAARLCLELQVYFVGYRDDVPKLLPMFDVYVHPARFEGMPNVVLEAMAAARPIVATDIDGTRELIRDGDHGWLVPPENPEALAKAIRLALSDRDEARRRGDAARGRVAEHFNIETMVNAWEKVLLGKVR
jgi:glycosyltransferase involved in cell wall biosynthesis